ncbi:putative peptidoglycan binding domain protein [Planctomycetes bacterium CA13]|uniref:Putative peptidoglycan binding domain protein n=1 Tax=Novipirellula herctigrandis TaxID=2527986 RepID=A0A5C5Z5J6_9BACT|nr:putative peptidoglycan binding domain protein [Planctomycetes bacterium CA13]
MITNLRIGSRGSLVKKLQLALNAKLRPSRNLAPDGIFGGKTYQAVKAFQVDRWLVEDGVAGVCTQNALYDKETYLSVLHLIPFIPQPTLTTCWAASTAMMTNSTVAKVKAKTPQDMWSDQAGLFNKSNTNDAMTSGNRYARIHNLRCNPPMSWALSRLRSALQRSPLMFDMLWNADDYVKGVGSPGHMICVIGIRGDDDPSGIGTTLRLHDPWKPNIGKKKSVNAMKWLNEVPTRTYRVFAK